MYVEKSKKTVVFSLESKKKKQGANGELWAKSKMMVVGKQGVWVWVSTSLLAAAASTVTEKVTSKALENASGKAFATE